MRPFLISYGGGHAQILIALAQEMQKRGRSFDILGLTTAFEAFRDAGLDALSIEALINPEEDAPFAREVEEFLPPTNHPAITEAQTRAYFTLGYRDLVLECGAEKARAAITEDGRLSFLPQAAFERYFEAIKPSVVVSTTSPRFELAAVKAARAMGIPSIAIGDMYLLAEQEWILARNYAEHLTVISESVAEMLRSAGLCGTQLHVLGNPAFDRLASSDGDADRKAKLRTRMGFGGGDKVVLWPLGGHSQTEIGRELLTIEEVQAFFTSLRSIDPSIKALIRPHPNYPVPEGAFNGGVVDGSLTAEDSLLAADVVCAEASTMGLQAVLMGIPTICYKFAHYVLYPGYGWASATSSLDEMQSLLLSGDYIVPPASVRDFVGGSAKRIADLIVKKELKSKI